LRTNSGFFQSKSQIKYHDLKNYDPSIFCKELNEKMDSAPSSIKNSIDPDTATDFLAETLTNLQNKHIPIKTKNIKKHKN